MNTFGRLYFLVAVLMCFVIVAPASADALYTLTLPSTITVAPGTTGSLPATFTNLGPDSVFIGDAVSSFNPGIQPTTADATLGPSLVFLLNTPLAPGVYNFTLLDLTVFSNAPPGFVTDISSILQVTLNLDPVFTPSAFSAPIVTVFSVGASPSLGSDVTVSGTATVPEPSSLLLLGTGLIGIVVAAGRKWLG